jgi:hypothetical protein
MKKLLISGTAGLTLAAGALLFAQGPMVNIGNRHPNLRSAQQSISQAYRSIEQAQGANRGRLGGHAERAKSLLAQADRELRMAADYANGKRR